ncbi:MAG TPA: PKD domain-containing protein, partial [Thermoplasmata archaeon]|nr:PKD domain-containing protein [Thermoplasmata archaeon]
MGLPSALPLAPSPSTNDSVPHWTSLGPIPSPPPRIDAAFASDPSTGVAALFGGYRNATPCGLFSTCPLGDTWVLVGSTWTNVTPASITPTNSPSARWGASFAFDPRISEFVLFGGVSAVPNGANQPAHNDTWLFSPSLDRWARICTACPGGNHTPSGRWDSGTTYDPSNDDVLLFGGANATTGIGGPIVELNDSWWFNGSAWNPLVSSRAPPSARDSPSLAWDGALREPLLFGGIPATADTWALTGAGWTSLSPSNAPSARGGALTATDPINGSVVLFGGCLTNPCSSGSINETWSYLGSDWVQLVPDPSQAPDARDHAGLVPRSVDGPLVLFGGDPGGTPSNDSWLLYHLESSAVKATLRALDVSQTTAFNASVVGGLPPIELSWIGLPHGCGSANVSDLPCTPTLPNSVPTDVKLVATDALGERVEAPGIPVVVNPLPTVSALARPISGVAPLQVTLLATGAGGTGTLAYNGTFGDGTIGVGPNPSHTYLGSGNFTVTVRV